MVKIDLPIYWSPETALAVHEWLEDILIQIRCVYSEELTEAAMDLQKNDVGESIKTDEFDDKIDF